MKELTVKNLTPPFASVTSISYKTDVFDVYIVYVTCPCDINLWPFYLEMV